MVNKSANKAFKPCVQKACTHWDQANSSLGPLTGRYVRIKMKNILIPLLLIYGTNASAITIEGNSKYKTQVKKCLKLLSIKARTEYRLVKKHIGVIYQSDKSGMNAWENPPRYLMSDRTAFYSITWCASTIAHDAYHSYLYQKYKPSNSKKTPYDKWGGFKAEKEAIKYQEKVMKKIGSSNHEINYLKKLDGTHGDYNKDGKLDSTDYKKRNW